MACELSFHYWTDEAISVGISSHPLRRLPSLLRQDGSPPLCYALLHVWMGMFGHGEVATHALSLVFAVLTIPTARHWLSYLSHDARLRLVTVSDRHAYLTALPVRGWLFAVC